MLNRKAGKVGGVPGLYDRYVADIASTSDAYPYGMPMNGRTTEHTWSRSSFNGQMKDDEVYGKGNMTTALNWQYDARLGPQGRWNRDPKPDPSISPYATFKGNPILFSDVLGDTTHIYDNRGVKVGSIFDKLPNQIHFLKEDFSKLSVEDQLNYRLHLQPKYAEKWRSQSAAFIGENTVKDMEGLSKYASDNSFETGFAMEISSTREIKLIKLSDKYVNTDRAYGLPTAVRETFSMEQQLKLLGAGHVHYDKLIDKIGGISSFGEYTGQEARFQRLLVPSEWDDYQKVLIRNPETGLKGQSPLLLLTNKGFAVYGSADKGQIGVKPNDKQDVYKYDSFKK